MIKYQKSMMKIMESLFNYNSEKTIEFLIKDSKTGRNSSFEALNFLEKIGFVKIEKLGNQKRVILIKNNYTFQFKYYLDVVKLKGLDNSIRLVLNLLNLELSKFGKFKFGVIFGSVLSKGPFNDLDILLIGDRLEIKDLRDLDNIKKKLERFTGIILNLHLGDSTFENISKGIVFYQSSYIFNLSEIQKQYLEFFESYCEGIFGGGNKNLFDVALLNLSYVFCNLIGFSAKTKKEARDFFGKKYKIKNLDELKKRGIQIGKEVFG